MSRENKKTDEEQSEHKLTRREEAFLPRLKKETGESTINLPAVDQFEVG